MIVFASGVPFNGDVGPCYGFIRSSFSYCRAQEKEVNNDNVTKRGRERAEWFRMPGLVVQRPISANPGLNLNPGIFFFCSLAFSPIVFFDIPPNSNLFCDWLTS